MPSTICLASSKCFCSSSRWQTTALMAEARASRRLSCFSTCRVAPASCVCCVWKSASSSASKCACLRRESRSCSSEESSASTPCS
ncbi:hypothetical protein TGFOU_406340 [Toxoplasma gondii FOU]|uniref:Uncharacterized protein n=1 Tax=Toxoplasma gondii FOU TaxID=943167 RepID=A0A086JMN5_TOXGO|nr:hypothetical protein TGFOU_406340 [Toxoplasma gondii FOU]